MNASPLISRRQALKTAGLVATSATLSAAVISEEGCNAQEWLQAAINNVPTLLNISLQIINIVGLYSSQGAADPAVIAKATQVANEVQSDAKKLQDLLAQYSGSNNQKTLLGEIYTILSTIQSNLDTILSMLHVYNSPLQAAIGIAITSALAVVTGIQVLMPVPSPLPASATPARMAAAKAAKENNPSAAVKMFYNQAMAAIAANQFAIQ